MCFAPRVAAKTPLISPRRVVDPICGPVVAGDRAATLIKEGDAS